MFLEEDKKIDVKQFKNKFYDHLPFSELFKSKNHTNLFY